jgi:hypothetical protein
MPIKIRQAEFYFYGFGFSSPTQIDKSSSREHIRKWKNVFNTANAQQIICLACVLPSVANTVAGETLPGSISIVVVMNKRRCMRIHINKNFQLT